MIRDVYVLRRTGEVLAHKAFSKRGVDEAIFSGFYSALSAFAEEMGHGGIETIRMGDVSFYYQHANEYLFAIAADKSHDSKAALMLLTDVKKRFLSKFKETLTQWSGDPTLFQSFTKDIEQAITESHETDDGVSVLALPFALDSTRIQGRPLEHPEINGDYILDIRQELAAVHLLLDDIRQNTPGLQPINEGCYEFLVKLLWPIWVVECPDSRILLIDGLKLIQPTVSRGFVPPSNRYESLLKVDASLEYVAIMSKLEEEVRTAARSSPFDANIIPADLAHPLRDLYRLAEYKSELAVQLPSLLTKKQAIKEAASFHAETIGTYQDAIEQWNEFLTYFQQDVQGWINRINQETTDLHEHYETKRKNLKSEIDKALTKLAKEEEAENAKVEDWRIEQEYQLLSTLRTGLTPIDNQLAQQREQLDQLLANKVDDHHPAENYIGALIQFLDTFGFFTSQLRNQQKAIKKQIQQVQKDLDELTKQVRDRKYTVRHHFESLEAQQVARLDALESEREHRIQEAKERLHSLTDQAQKIEALIQQHIVHSEEQLKATEKYLLAPGAPFSVKPEKPIYVPFYLAGLHHEDDTTRYLVIPPLQVPTDKRQQFSQLGQHKAPVAALAPPFITYLKEKLEEALNQDPNFAKQITRLAPRHNLLSDPHIESLLYSGLHTFWQSHWIPEHVHTQVKLACIDAYRTAHDGYSAKSSKPKS